MDTSGPLPILDKDDPVSEVAQYTEEMAVRLSAAAEASFALNVSGYAGEVAIVNKTGPLVTLQGRVKRTATGMQLLVLPVGFRPPKDVFCWTIKGANTSVLLQINSIGQVSTPFDTAISDFMILTTFGTLNPS